MCCICFATLSLGEKYTNALDAVVVAGAVAVATLYVYALAIQYTHI